MANCRYHCAACGAHFTSERGFEKHRKGTHEPNTRHCVKPEGKSTTGECRIARGPVQKGVTVYS